MFGPLVGGTVLPVSLATARRLLDPECAVLTELGAAIPFEVAVGVNGVVWVQAAGGAWGGKVVGRRAKASGCVIARYLTMLPSLTMPFPLFPPTPPHNQRRPPSCFPAVKETIAVRNAIAAEGLTAAQSRLLVRRVLQSIATG